MKIKDLKGKRSQEEMVGFMLIIVLVTIISLVFLILSIRKPVERQEDVKIKSFIYSLLRHSIECGENIDFKDLIVKCYGGELCLDRNACQLLKEISYDIVDSEWGLDKYNAYFFKIYIKNDSLVDLKKGNCTGTKKGSSVVTPIFGESVFSDLEICF